jgi:hypothetical protein
VLPATVKSFLVLFFKKELLPLLNLLSVRRHGIRFIKLLVAICPVCRIDCRCIRDGRPNLRGRSCDGAGSIVGAPARRVTRGDGSLPWWKSSFQGQAAAGSPSHARPGHCRRGPPFCSARGGHRRQMRAAATAAHLCVPDRRVRSARAAASPFRGRVLSNRPSFHLI